MKPFPFLFQMEICSPVLTTGAPSPQVIGFTHLMFALALTYLSGFPVVYGMIGGILPDADLLLDLGFPLTHRGIVHTPLVAFLSAFALFLLTGRRAPAAALGTGYLSHLFIDTFTYSGIMWLFPLKKELSFEMVGYADVSANLGIIALSIILPLGWRYRDEVRIWMR